MITQELMDKFFRNECDSEEKERIASYLQDHPRELEKYLDEEEWEGFKTTEELPSSVSEKLFSNVLREQRKGSYFGKPVLKRLALRLTVAAGLLLLAGAGWKLFVHRQQSCCPALTAQREGFVSENADSLQNIRNNSGDKMAIVLKDGSLIELYPESAVSFDKKWGASQRLLYLSGKANFKVAKDKSRPFIVYSDEIATTVLGTSFTVTSFKTDNTIKVGLHDGKVLVRSADPRLVKLPDDLYLSAGDLLVYNKKSKLARVLTPHTGSPGIALKANGASVPDWYMFKGQSLDQVFDQLSLYYGVQIDYSPSDTRNRYFSGRYEKRDTLEGILRDIVLLNGLSVSKQDERYIVRKKNH